MKVNAFTLMEVTVAMLVSAICITICYTAYGIVTNYYAVFQEKNEKAAMTTGLKQVLEKDFLRADLVVSTDSGLKVSQDSVAIIYTFDQEKVVRELQGLHTDTFKIATSRPEFKFENQTIVESDTIDELSFKVPLGKGLNAPISIRKIYSSTNLFH